MSELRPWSEEGGSPDELRLLEAARGERLSPAARSRILAGVGATALVATSATTAAAAGSGVGLLTKLVVATVLVGGVGAGVAWKATGWSRPRAAPSPAVTAVATAVDPPPVQAPPAEAGDTPAAPGSGTSAPEPAATAAPRARAPSVASSATLSDEVRALDRARRALSSDSPETALRELGRYERRFPKGALGAEETVLRVQALLARGDNERAVALADQFAAAHPDSPYARRVLELVRVARKK
jgi:hypothetical protein